MEKELEALENLYSNYIDDSDYHKSNEDYRDFCIVKKALLNFKSITEQIKNAKPKNAIGLLNRVKDNLDSYTYNTILEILLKSQQQENEIIEKVVKNLEKFRPYVIAGCSNEEYNNLIDRIRTHLKEDLR